MRESTCQGVLTPERHGSRPVSDKSKGSNIHYIPKVDAGSGKIAITILEVRTLVSSKPDIDGENWTGNAHYATTNVSYYHITFSLNALDSSPVFHTVRVSPDPVQIGASASTAELP